MKFVFCIAVFLFTTPLLANELQDATDSQNCWVEAGTLYQIDPWLLYAIAEQESSLNPHAINENSNLSKDVGLMQINSFWFDKLEVFGITEESLYHPCISIHVGAWILAQTIAQYGNNWRAVGAYNAGTRDDERTEELRKKYAQRVFERYQRNTR